jgi:excisionase family DNA binding protein
MSEFLTLSDVAKLLRVSKPTVKKCVATQGLPALRLGERVWRFSRVDVEAWMKAKGVTLGSSAA